MNTFNVGNVVKKNYPLIQEDTYYVIVELYDVYGGNFYNGFTTTKFAKLNDNTIHEISFNNNMANIHILFNYLTN